MSTLKWRSHGTKSFIVTKGGWFGNLQCNQCQTWSYFDLFSVSVCHIFPWISFWHKAWSLNCLNMQCLLVISVNFHLFFSWNNLPNSYSEYYVLCSRFVISWDNNDELAAHTLKAILSKLLILDIFIITLIHIYYHFFRLYYMWILIYMAVDNPSKSRCCSLPYINRTHSNLTHWHLENILIILKV